MQRIKRPTEVDDKYYEVYRLGNDDVYIVAVFPIPLDIGHRERYWIVYGEVFKTDSDIPATMVKVQNVDMIASAIFKLKLFNATN